MARTLKGKIPDTVKPSRIKAIVFGPPGVRKTSEALNFPSNYYIDTEGGATGPQYTARLIASGGVYFGKDEGSQDFPAVIDELRTLATVEHPYKTVTIDSFSKLYNIAAANAEARVGNEYGRDKKEAQKPTRQLMLWLERLDMNVLLICHAKEKWVRVGNQLTSAGKTFDGFEKMEYDLDLCLEILPNTGADPIAVVRKSRLTEFPQDGEFPWSFAEISRRCPGLDMVSKPFALATAEELLTLHRLIDTVKVEDDWLDRVMSKAGVSTLEEMGRDKVQACIAFLQAKVPGVQPTPAQPAPLPRSKKSAANGQAQQTTA